MSAFDIPDLAVKELDKLSDHLLVFSQLGGANTSWFQNYFDDFPELLARRV